MMRTIRNPFVFVLALLLTAAAAPSPARADRGAAKKLNGAGMKAYRKENWEGAAESFRKAIAADGDLVLAHYNLACVESLRGNSNEAMAELRWLARSPDPEAKAKLHKALTDPDLDFVSTIAELRSLVGLPGWDALSDLTRLTERNGVWGAEGDFCGSAWVLLTFKGKSATAKGYWGCDENEVKTSDTGTVSVEKDGVFVSFKKKRQQSELPERAQVAFAPCEGRPEVICASVGDLIVHRGRPERSFSVPLK